MAGKREEFDDLDERTTTPNRPRRPSVPPVSPIGVAFLLLGMTILAYFCFVYDTTSLNPFNEYRGTRDSRATHQTDRVYNFGLMANQVCGTIVGIGFMAIGSLYILLFNRRSR